MPDAYTSDVSQWRTFGYCQGGIVY